MNNARTAPPFSTVPKPSVNITPHPEITRLLQAEADAEHRSLTSLIEQCAAEHLMIPLAHPDLPEQPAELCPHCERGVIYNDQCPVCHKWIRGPARAGYSGQAHKRRQSR